MSEFFAIHHSRKNIKSLIILDVLMAMTLDPETGVKRETVFQDAYEIYLSFSRNANLANLCVLKTSFKDLILHPDYGIYILHMFAERYVSLQPVTQILVVFWMLQLKQLTRMIFILNTYWTKPSPLSKIVCFHRQYWATAKPEPNVARGSILFSIMNEAAYKKMFQCYR